MKRIAALLMILCIGLSSKAQKRVYNIGSENDSVVVKGDLVYSNFIWKSNSQIPNIDFINFKLSYLLPASINYDTFKFKPFQIFWNGSNAEYNYNIRSEIAGKITTIPAYYCDAIHGDDGNDGLSWATAKKTLRSIIEDPSIRLVYLRGGMISRQNHQLTTRVTVNKDTMIMIGIGDTYLTSYEDLGTYTWGDTIAAGIAKSSPMDSVGNIVDYGVMDSSGIATMYKRVSNLQSVVDTTSSWYAANGVVYIHTTDGRFPDDKIRISNAFSAYTGQISFRPASGDNLYMYFENIKFHGVGIKIQGYATTNIKKNSHWRFVDCEAAFTTITPGISSALAYGFFAYYIGSAYFQNCIAYKTEGDGFHYENPNGTSFFQNILELNCSAYKNGTINKDFSPSPRDASNGSSSHGNSYILRLNSSYYENRGQNVSDIGNTISMAVGCNAFQSFAIPNTHTDTTDWFGRNSDYGINDGVMFLYNCKSSSSEYSVYTESLIPSLTKGTAIIKSCLFNNIIQ